MTLIMKSAAYVRCNPVQTNAHRERKRVVDDLLKWDAGIVCGESEIDQAGNEGAVDLISADGHGNPLGSFRLLPTVRPHIPGSRIAELCDAPVPAGANVFQISRARFSARIGSAKRIRIRNQLVTAAVEFALFNDVDTFTCVATAGMYSQILALGWMCEPLGLPRMVGDDLTGALRISVTRETPRLLLEAGTYVPSKLELATAALLAA